MDWNSIIQWFNEQWVAISSTSVLGILSIKTFILDKLNLNKNVSGYSALQTTVIAKENEHTAQLEIIYDEFKKLNARLDVQNEKIDKVLVQNAQFTSLITQTLSMANVPLQAKESFLQNLKSIDVVNLQTLESLKQTLDVQKIAQDLQAKATQVITEKINNL